ncbi:MAG: aspartate 1-decarboxylase [Victivallales bacterium]|nr:aspartate 1-decarboxylase [Victivallales bacterium]MBT7164082.1 aspartate 1-decarboxylase [Victivallales bacterium]MBT7303839.1 aspartate 1-decarboxylase [Victivallales bacterium]
MDVQILRSKLHRVTLTACELEYEGSLTIDPELMDVVGMFPFERILVVNQTNGERLETYIIVGRRGSREFCLNGAAARRGQPGDMLTIMTFGSVPVEVAATTKPKVAILDAANNVLELK